jgi:hypothetical protein
VPAGHVRGRNHTMTTGERWTVYPLLLLAIGLALRAAIVAEGRLGVRLDSLEVGRIECRGLAVVAPDGTVVLEMGRVIGGDEGQGGGGRIEIKDAAGVDAVAIGTGTASRDGVVEFFDAEGQPAGLIGSGSGVSPAQTSHEGVPR